MIREISTMDRPIERSRWTLKRRLWIALLAVAAVAGAAVLARPVVRWLAADTSVELSQVRIGTVSRGDLERDFSVQGRIVAAFHPTLYSPAAGTVERIAQPGEAVALGAVLARVLSPELESRLKQEESTLASLAADLERQRILARQTNLQNEREAELYRVRLEAARRGMERAERTRAEGLLNAVQYEEAQDALRVAGLELEAAEQAALFEGETLDFDVRNRESLVERQRLVVEELRRQVEELAIRSPAAGVVARFDVEDRDAVAAGQAIAGVVDLSAFEAEIQVPEAYAAELAPGTPALILYEGREWPGEVRVVSPEVAASQIRCTVAFADPEPEGLRQNQRVTARLVLESKPGVLKVPRGPFVEAGGGRQAYVVDDGLAVARSVQLGVLSVSEVEVVAGLEEGERIIVSDTARFEGALTVLLRGH